MRDYLIRRFLLLILTVWGVSVVIFLIMRVVPGDPIMALMGEGGATKEQIAKIRRDLGLDRPLVVQYFDWLWDTVRLDLGKSLWKGTEISYELKTRLPVTLQLAIMSLILSVVIALVTGIVSALKQDTWWDYAFRVFTIAGLALPAFWVGILVILMLALWFNWLPTIEYVPFFENPRENLLQFIFPALVIGWRQAAVTGRMVRSSMLEVLREDYIRTARAKGLAERIVIFRHALKNASLPVVTVIGIEATLLLGGVVVIEQVFSMPGLGRALVSAIYYRDYPMVQFLVTFFAFVTVVINLIVDLTYGWLDPRIRYE
ncbi:MAG: ABC transporter permease [Dehalococcoidia bacterium]|nr:ABC transporter permease [Dehalococcoidia bacterium]MDW8119105.1 ABC transporter permease [Chloroflexota bacterium]